MRTFVQLDREAETLLCCPLCKGRLFPGQSAFNCTDCGSAYPLVDAPGGGVYDFRIHRPSYVTPPTMHQWNDIQAHYVDFNEDSARRDSLQEYRDEIDSVKEIYAEEFQLSGRVLDVGGHQGRLRHFLSPAETRCYISVDPVLDIFRTADRPNLLQAYPCLSTACNFVCSHAEALPFVAGQFDWVHMRSVLDHFSDPYLALREAYRVVRPGGQVLIGLTIMERMVHARPAFSERVKRKLRDEGPLALVRAATRRLGRGSAGEPDDHNFRLTHSQLLDLIARTGFRVTREHWQKPPFRHVIYVSGTKPGAR